jgi:hypothetical protein
MSGCASRRSTIGYGPVGAFIFDRYPHATRIAQDGPEPMLKRSRALVAKDPRQRIFVRGRFVTSDGGGAWPSWS